MEKMAMVDKGWGSFLKYKMLTETRPFAQVEDALVASGIQERHKSPLLQRPKASTAFTRSMGYLARVCMSSIPFPAGSPNQKWEENGVECTAERNPNYSLKIESVKGTPDGEVSYRINISDRRCKDENMAHVLTATYRAGLPIEFLPSVDQAAWDKFGEDIRTLVNEANTKFSTNYDDTDVRDVVVAELKAIKAVNVLGKTTNFIAKDTEARPDNTERAQKLVQFVTNCGHLVSLLGLDATEMTRDAIVSELRASIMGELEEYEADLDEKLGTKTKERARGEKRRASMKANAEANIDRIMALAEYHAEVLGVMADGITAKAAALKAKAQEFLTRDFGAGVPKATQQAAAQGKVLSDLEKKIAELEAELAQAKGGAVKAVVPAQIVVDAAQAFA